MTTEPKPIPPMPERDGSIQTSYSDRLESWGRDLASRLETAERVIAALEPGEENPLTVARRLKRERVELGMAINRLAQALGWPSIVPDRPFGEQVVDATLGHIASSTALAGELAEALEGVRPLYDYQDEVRIERGSLCGTELKSPSPSSTRPKPER